MLVKPLQWENAQSPIEVTLLGIVMFVKPVQPQNAQLPIEVTLSGIVIPVKPVQPKNASFPIEVTLSGMTYIPCFPCGHILTFDLSLLNKTPLFDENTVLFLLTVMFVKPVQFKNAEPPIEVTLSPMVTLVKPVQP